MECRWHSLLIFKRSETFSFNSQLPRRANDCQFLEFLIHFFPIPPSVYPIVFNGSLAGRLTRLAAGCQHFLMSAVLGLLCLSFTVNNIVFQWTLGNGPVCRPESARGCDYLFGPFQIRKDAPGSPTRRSCFYHRRNESHTQGWWGFLDSVEKLFIVNNSGHQPTVRPTLAMWSHTVYLVNLWGSVSLSERWG